MQRKVIYILLVILSGLVLLCYLRWDAWFTNPPEPKWENDTLESKWGRDSLVYRFPTFASDSVFGFVLSPRGWQSIWSKDTLQFVVLGDVHNGMDSTQWDAMAARHPQVGFYAQVGDFLERCYPYYYYHLVEQLQGTRFANLPVLAVPGNHEYTKGVVRTLDARWHAWFPEPQNGPLRFLGTSYYVDFPNLRFIVLDTNGLQRLSDFTMVNTWLTHIMQTAEGRFVAVMMHHPVYSHAVGRQTIPIRLFFGYVLQNADIVFTGHDHIYARRLPYIGLNSARKYYLSTLDEQDVRICSGRQLYDVCTLVGDTLTASAYLMDSGEKYDEIKVVKTPQGRQYINLAPTIPEIIELPAQYQHSKKRKVKNFLRARSLRLNE